MVGEVRGDLSGVYGGVTNTPRALRLARIALASCAPGHAEVRLFDKVPARAGGEVFDGVKQIYETNCPWRRPTPGGWCPR